MNWFSGPIPMGSQIKLQTFTTIKKRVLYNSICIFWNWKLANFKQLESMYYIINIWIRCGVTSSFLRWGRSLVIKGCGGWYLGGGWRIFFCPPTLNSRIDYIWKCTPLYSSIYYSLKSWVVCRKKIINHMSCIFSPTSPPLI